MTRSRLTAALRLPLASLAVLLITMLGATSAHAAEARKPRTVEVAVSDQGTQPAKIDAKAGEPLRLVVTRKTDATCVKDIVMKEFGVNQPLPLNQPVIVEITPKKAGTFRAVCGMGMEFASLEVK